LTRYFTRCEDEKKDTGIEKISFLEKANFPKKSKEKKKKKKKQFSLF